jgi:hypothetical protein
VNCYRRRKIIQINRKNRKNPIIATYGKNAKPINGRAAGSAKSAATTKTIENTTAREVGVMLMTERQAQLPRSGVEL